MKVQIMLVSLKSSARAAVWLIISVFSASVSFAEPQPGTLSAGVRDGIEKINDIRGPDRDALRDFYAARDFTAVWVDQQGPTRAARLALEEFANADSWGLDADVFQAVASRTPMSGGGWSAAEAAAAELEISLLAIKYAQHARGGRISDPTNQLTTYIDRAPALPEAADILADVTIAADPGAVLRDYQPKHPQFAKLKDYLARLQAQAAQQKELQIAAKGPALIPTKSYSEIAVLRRRFALQAAEGAEDVYDEALAAAVKQFQGAMSLKADGIVGLATRKALNVNVADKIATVVGNMEQWRWMPADLGATHIFVNVPSYSIDFVKDGVATFSERVIVGKESTQTPIFSHEMATIVMRPEWYLPDSIKLKKLLSGRPLESQGLRVKRNGRVVNSSKVDWGKANLSAYAVYQPSGGSNALGAVKFLFPNKHSVYLHDTPEKSLFGASDRNFSAGCIRVRNPLTLAQHIFDHDQGAGALDAMRLARKGPESNEITLQKPLPVHIAHFTVWIGDDGKAQFMRDRYGHQKRIALALGQKWKDIDRGKDHLAAVDTSGLKGISLRARSKRVLDGPLTDPVGLTNAFPGYRGGYKGPPGVGDLIRRAFGG